MNMFFELLQWVFIIPIGFVVGVFVLLLAGMFLVSIFQIWWLIAFILLGWTGRIPPPPDSGEW